MVAKDAKVDTKVGIRGGLSGLSVRGFNTPRSLRTPRLIQKLGYVAVLADPVFAGWGADRSNLSRHDRQGRKGW